MKDFNKLEEHFNKMANEQEATPPSFVWDNIENELPKKEKNNRRFFFWILGLLCVFGIGLYQFTHIDAHTSLSQNERSDVKQIEQVLKNDELNSIKQTTQIPTQSSETNIDKLSPTIKKLNKASNNSANISVYTLEGATEVSSPEIMLNAHKELASDFSSNNQRYKPNTISQQALSSNSSSKENLLLAEPISQKEEQKNLQSKPSNFSQDASLPPVAKVRPSVNPFTSLLFPKTQVLPEGERVNLELQAIVDDKNAPKTKFFFEVGSLMGLHDFKLDTALSAMDTTSFHRTSTESNWYTWGLNAQIGFQVSDNFYVKSGMNFIESKDKFDFLRESTILVDSLNQVNLDTFSTIAYFNRGDITYRQFNIPLTIGGSINRGKLMFGLEGTALLNFRFMAEGKVYLGDLEFSRIENEEIYKSKLGFGYSLSAFTGINLNSKSSLLFKPTYTNYRSTVNLNSYPSKSMLRLFYLEMAYRYRF